MTEKPTRRRLPYRGQMNSSMISVGVDERESGSMLADNED